MKSNRLTIRINRPVNQVFEYVTNPANTPNWIEFISKEETNEWPPKLGTIYHNQDKAGEWRDLDVTEFEPDKMFVMTNRASDYHVRYALTPINGGTQLEYFEWTDDGELDEPFTLEPLQKLKTILENKE